MKLVRNACIFVLYCLLTGIIGQVLKAQDPVFSQFYAAPIYLNPAFAGSTNCRRLASSYRQMRGPENFHTLNISYDTYVDALRGGVGLMVTSDLNNLVVRRNSIGGFYAYRLHISREVNMHIGLQAAYLRNDSNWDHFIFANPEEPPPDRTFDHVLDFASGVLLLTPRFYGGLAVHHMNEARVSMVSYADSDENRLDIKYTAHMGMYLEPDRRPAYRASSYDYFLSPNIIYQHQGGFAHVSLGLYAGAEPIMVGAWYRHHWVNGNATGFLVFLLGLNLEQYSIGYSYDHSLSGFSEIMDGIHEISLTLRFNCPQINIRQRIINNPRF